MPPQKNDDPMKRYLIFAATSAVVFIVLLVILNALFGGVQSFWYYLVAGVLYGLVFGAFNYLQEKRNKGKDDK